MRMSFKNYLKDIQRDRRYHKLRFNVDNKIHYVYRVSKDGLHYYGSRTDKIQPLIGIKYFTSSMDKDFKADFKNNTSTWKIKIIRTFCNRSECILFESYLHNFFDARVHQKFINRSNQTPFGFDVTGVFVGGKHPQAKEIYQLDRFTGSKIKSWPSTEEANNFYGITNVGNCIRNLNNTAGGYVWCYPDAYTKELQQHIINTNYEDNTGKAKEIYQLDRFTGNKIKEWPSIEEANAFYGITSIGNCARNVNKTAGGYVWCYPDGYTKGFIQLVIDTNYESNTGKAKGVYQLDRLLFNVVGYFESASKAAKSLGIQQSGITKSARQPGRLSGGFAWAFQESYPEEFNTQVKKWKDRRRGGLSHLAKRVRQFDTTGKCIKEWDSVTEAAEALNLKRDQIATSARLYLTKQYQHGGYLWSY